MDKLEHVKNSVFLHYCQILMDNLIAYSQNLNLSLGLAEDPPYDVCKCKSTIIPLFLVNSCHLISCYIKISVIHHDSACNQIIHKNLAVVKKN